MADAIVDAPIDVPSDSLTCFGVLKSICFTAVPTGTISISGAIDTGTDVRCAVYPQAGGPDLCVISGAMINVAATTAKGPRPLVLIGTTAINVTGTLDVTSSSGGLAGAGSGGGGFGAVGGAGGRGANNGTAGAAGQVLGVTQLRGGCPGGKGGDGDGSSGGVVGLGGGAVALIAGTTIGISTNGAVCDRRRRGLHPYLRDRRWRHCQDARVPAAVQEAPVGRTAGPGAEADREG